MTHALEQLRADLAAKDVLHNEAKKVAEAKKRELEAFFTEQFEKQAIDDAAKALEAEAQGIGYFAPKRQPH